MSLRLLQVVLPRRHRDELAEMLKSVESDRFWSIELDEDQVLTTVVTRAEQVEGLADALCERFDAHEGFRLVLVPAEATRPKLPEPEQAPADPASEPEDASAKPKWKPLIGRVAREELEEDLARGGSTTPLFVAMVVLSSIVACAGLVKDSPAVIIGAMVIAPLLGPNMALALGTTLGDVRLIKRSVRTNVVGIVVALAFSGVLGAVMGVDRANGGLAARAVVDLSDIAAQRSHRGRRGRLPRRDGRRSGTLRRRDGGVAALAPDVRVRHVLRPGSMRGRHAAELLGVNIVCINLAATLVSWCRACVRTPGGRRAERARISPRDDRLGRAAGVAGDAADGDAGLNAGVIPRP
ncbi:MAG: DUF389 domain-containing protein [Phycisphaerales bacterium]